MRRGAIAAFAGLLLAQSVAAEQVYANRTLRVGSVLAASDLSGPAGAMVGMEVRRAIYAGHPVSPPDLGPPTMVRRNEIVMMSYRSGGIALRAEGRALAAGGVGELVEVMNLVSRRTIRAVVTGKRAVEVRR